MLVLSQDRVFVEHYIRQSSNHWLIIEYSERSDSAELLGAAFKVEDIYDGMELSYD